MSSSTIHDVAVAGAGGNLGSVFVSKLQAAGFKVTVLARTDSSSNTTWPSDVIVKPVDYSSKESLITALKGQQAVVAALSGPGMTAQVPLIDAAVEAGVYRFIPSEFGSDTQHPRNATTPVFEGKRIALAHLKQKTAENPSLTYTALITGPFLDFCLRVPLILDCKNRKATLLDEGDRRISVSTIPQAGDAVVGVLKNPKATENRIIKVGGTVITQNELLQIAEKVTGSKWEVDRKSSQDLEPFAYEERHKPDANPQVVNGAFLRAVVFGEGRGNDFSDQVENDLFGLKPLSPQEVQVEVEKAIQG